MIPTAKGAKNAKHSNKIFASHDKHRTETNRDELTSIEFVSSSYRFGVNRFPRTNFDNDDKDVPICNNYPPDRGKIIRRLPPGPDN